jgi:nanoRNase/pAp phosphatase (c-di-AMP/oligoRNAs hydrolase)
MTEAHLFAIGITLAALAGVRTDTGHFLMIERHRLDFYARLLRLLEANIGSGRAMALALPSTIGPKKP